VLLLDIVAGVATRTIRLKSRELPDDQLRVGLVTLRTSEIAAVVHWFKRKSCVREFRWRPRCGVMAAIALLCGNKMSGVLSRRSYTVVAGRTGPQNLSMVDGQNRCPHRCRVAVLANIRRLYVLRPFTRRIRTVVATKAVRHDIDMIKIRWQPGKRCMAVIAVVSARNMCRMFARRYHPIVAS